MDYINEIPPVPEKGFCDKHGEYEFKYLKFLKKVMVTKCCSACVTENAERDKLSAKKLQADTDIENEKQRRENARVNAGISKRNLYKTFNDYICTNEGQTKAKNDCMRYVENFPNGKSLIMVGGVGTGKTLLVSAMIDFLADNNNCQIVKVIDIVREFKSTWSKESTTDEQSIIKKYQDLDLLIIDEVGSQFGSDTEKLFIFDVIDARYQEIKSTVLISNLDINGINDAIGERCVDRLREGGGSMIAFDWKSSRN